MNARAAHVDEVEEWLALNVNPEAQSRKSSRGRRTDRREVQTEGGAEAPTIAPGEVLRLDEPGGDLWREDELDREWPFVGTGYDVVDLQFLRRRPRRSSANVRGRRAAGGGRQALGSVALRGRRACESKGKRVRPSNSSKKSPSTRLFSTRSSPEVATEDRRVAIGRGVT